jgi:hypothetical protein
MIRDAEEVKIVVRALGPLKLICRARGGRDLGRGPGKLD